MNKTISLRTRAVRIPENAITDAARAFIRRTAPAASAIFTALALIFLLAGSDTCTAISALLAFALIAADDLIPERERKAQRAS